MQMSERIAVLRKKMSENGINAWIVPSADAHQSEYVADHWKSRAWISGFTGSAGTVAVTADKAGLWTDSRYFLQAEKQLAGSGIDLFRMGVEGMPTLNNWLNNNLSEKSVIGFDGSLLSVADYEQMENDFSAKQIAFKYNLDLIGEIWIDRPPVPMDPVALFPVEYAGESRQSKLERVWNEIETAGGNAHLIAALDDIAWLLNMRGKDIDFNPVAVGYLVIVNKVPHLFVEPEKISSEVKTELMKDGIVFHAYVDIYDFLQNMETDVSIIIDPSKTSQRLFDSIPDACTVIKRGNITLEMKSVKNATELEGFRQAHIRDGMAMVKFLYWLEENVGKIPMDEVSIADRLEEIRAQGKNYQGLSFETIVGYKENGAIVHYTADKESAKSIHKEGVLLIDSGAQYLDGTTDITRTLSLGNVSVEEKKCFSLVLKGHINLAMAIFPKGYNGSQIDALPRIAMWQEGYNYGHGTGHGIGHYLNVHEGPHQIRPTNQVSLRVGTVTSNEPGLYIPGKFGIRLENLIITTEAAETEFGVFYGFETITLCPIDKNLIEKKMMTSKEIDWLNDYHSRVFSILSPYLSKEEKNWLKIKTQPL